MVFVRNVTTPVLPVTPLTFSAALVDRSMKRPVILAPGTLRPVLSTTVTVTTPRYVELFEVDSCFAICWTMSWGAFAEVAVGVLEARDVALAVVVGVLAVVSVSDDVGFAGAVDVDVALAVAVAVAVLVTVADLEVDVTDAVISSLAVADGAPGGWALTRRRGASGEKVTVNDITEPGAESTVMATPLSSTTPPCKTATTIVSNMWRATLRTRAGASACCQSTFSQHQARACVNKDCAFAQYMTTRSARRISIPGRRLCSGLTRR
jgi:hypothetical protein